VYILFISFVLFAILAMVDFYRWNYNYGHELDPHAAIKVPGMAYQPPLIGYKQLLNFGAYSIPATGGIMFIISGLLFLFVVLKESGTFRKIFKRKKAINTLILLGGIMFLSSCSSKGPEPVKLNQDTCAYCKMTLTDPHFAAQLVTDKGRHYFFDDMDCMKNFIESNTGVGYDQFYISDYSVPSRFIDIKSAMLFHSDSLRSPMGGNIAAFANKDSFNIYATKYRGTEFSWEYPAQ
jgi:copper chaperone NosL